jgi:hypothetical protein
LDGGLFAPISIGADSSGHVVAVSLGRDSRWRAYDIARDRSRRVAVPTRRDCTIRQVAIWRQRTAIVRYCGGTEGEALLRVGHRTRVLARGGTIDADFLAIAGRSIVSGTYSDQGSGLRLLLDRGRRCPNDQVVLEPVDHAWHGLPGVWIGAHGLEWVMGAETALYSGRFADLAVMAVHLTGRCSAIATRWHVPTRRFRTVTAVAIDGHELYYATDEGIFRRRLTSRESDAPPANDSIEHATRLTGPLPVRVAGVVGHATLQGGEPVQSGVGRTVWYSWRPSTSERVTVNVAGPQYQWTGMFTGGPGLSTLAPVPPVDQCLANVFDVAARQTYWIATGTWGAEPSYAPFTLAITRRLPAPC